VFTGRLRFQGPEGQLVWYTLEARVSPAPEVASVDVSCPVGQATRIAVAVTNPLGAALALAATYSDPALVGPPRFVLPAGEVSELEFYYAPLAGHEGAARAGHVTLVSDELGELSWRVTMTALPGREAPEGGGGGGGGGGGVGEGGGPEAETALPAGGARRSGRASPAAATEPACTAGRQDSSGAHSGSGGGPASPAPAAAGGSGRQAWEGDCLERPISGSSAASGAGSSRFMPGPGSPGGPGGPARSITPPGGRHSAPAAAAAAAARAVAGTIHLEAAVGSSSRAPVYLYSSGNGPEPFQAQFTLETPLCFDVHVAPGAVLPVRPAAAAGAAGAAAAAAAGGGAAGGGGGGRAAAGELAQGAGEPALYVSFIGKELGGKAARGLLHVTGAAGVTCSVELVGRNPKYVKPAGAASVYGRSSAVGRRGGPGTRGP
jgi:hypothetical protein